MPKTPQSSSPGERNVAAVEEDAMEMRRNGIDEVGGEGLDLIGMFDRGILEEIGLGDELSEALGRLGDEVRELR